VKPIDHYHTLLRRRHVREVENTRWPNGSVIKLEPSDERSRYRHIYISGRNDPPIALATYKKGKIVIMEEHKHNKNKGRQK